MCYVKLCILKHTLSVHFDRDGPPYTSLISEAALYKGHIPSSSISVDEAAWKKHGHKRKVSNEEVIGGRSLLCFTIYLILLC